MNPASNLVKTLNELFRLYEKKNHKGSLRITEMERAIQGAIDATDQFLDTPQPLEKLITMRSQQGDVVQEIEEFQEYFIPFEQRVLKDAGLNPSIRIALIKMAKRRRTEIHTQPDSLSQVKENLRNAHSLLHNLKQICGSSPQDKQIVQQNWTKILYLVGGFTIIGVNAYFATTNPVASAMSAVCGSKIIADNLNFKYL